MANTSSRTLRLLSLLQARAHWPGPDLADRLGVSARTLRRDVERLRELGYPVHAAPGTDGGYRLAAGASLPPLALDDEEAVALAVALQTAAAGTDAGSDGAAEPSLRALAKVVQVMPPRLRRCVDALRAVAVSAPWVTTAGPDPAVLLTAAQACRDAERIVLRYTAADGTRTQRRVEPHALARLGRRWYLVAWDLDRAAWRTLRVDRIEQPELHGGRFRPRELPAADPVAVVEEGIRTAPASHDVRAVLHCSVEEARGRLGGWAQLEALDGQRCRLVVATEDLGWAAFALARADAEISDVEPSPLVALMQEWAARFARASPHP